MRYFFIVFFTLFFISGCIPLFSTQITMNSSDSTERIIKRADRKTIKSYISWWKDELLKHGWKESTGCYERKEISSMLCFLTSFDPWRDEYSVVLFIRSADKSGATKTEVASLVQKSKSTFRGVASKGF